jgi:hypothetical protein
MSLPSLPTDGHPRLDLLPDQLLSAKGAMPTQSIHHARGEGKLSDPTKLSSLCDTYSPCTTATFSGTVWPPGMMSLNGTTFLQEFLATQRTQ